MARAEATAAAGSESELGPAEGKPIDPAVLERLKKFYRDMLLIRRFEEKAGQLYGMGLIGGFCHLYIGQEAVVVGMRATLQPDDQVITTYRDHGHMLACGMEPAGVMAELTGRASGYSKGKGGSMHMFSREKNFFGGHGIVGANVPIGTGLAFANRYRQNGAVCLTYFGDGAANQGQVFEAFNMAELWKLPVVYIIENNQYAMGTAVGRSTAEVHLYKHGAAHNIYRYRGHSMSDPAKYRTREEVQQMREKHDPIDTFGARLVQAGIFTPDELKAQDREVRQIINHAAEFATESPEPAPEELYTDILK